MTIFFFVVGLEIKREMTTGHLSRLRNAIMPLLGALGGMAIPAAIYLLIAGDADPRGWGVPVATDIALAVGLLAIIGSSVAPSLRTFLLGLAVIDDIGAILIIAFIYSSGVGLLWVLAAIAVVLAVVAARKLGARSWTIYILLGLVLWYALYRSGIHATLSGVILGLLTPNIAKPDSELVNAEGNPLSIIEWLEAKLHPWSSFFIVPIFAFANTGVSISSDSIQRALNSPIAWGIFFGLVIGKPLGIIIAVTAAKKANIGDYPVGSSKSGLLATGSAAGIGFTVAIFIADLAFKNQVDQDMAVIAVILASVVSGLLSWILFSVISRRNSRIV
jgi:NhaA family Na+:H+ antiporter